MAQNCIRAIFLLPLLLQCLDSAAAQHLVYPDNIPTSLIPALCLILALVILVLCLIGFCLFCLSAFISLQSESEDLERGNTEDEEEAGKPEHSDCASSCEKDESPEHYRPASGEEDLAFKPEKAERGEDEAWRTIINMDLYDSRLKQVTRSLLERELEAVRFQDLRGQAERLEERSKDATTDSERRGWDASSPEGVVVVELSEVERGGQCPSTKARDRGDIRDMYQDIEVTVRG